LPFAALVLVASHGLIWELSSPSAHRRNESAQDYQSGGDAKLNGASDPASAVAAWSALALTLITGFLAYMAWQQSRTTRAQLRAYIGVETANYSVDLPKHEARIRIKNFGQTPAYNVVCRIGIEVAPDFTGKIDKKAETVRGNATVFPQHSLTIKRRTDLIAPDGDEPIGIFVFGRITYRDAFGFRRWTKFRFSANPKNGDVSAEEDGNDAS
jgi:hypothetical protein